MNIDRVKQFCAIVETENLTQAAQLLGMSSGTLSKAMKQLQEELGQKLLIPQGRGLAITEVGRRFYAYAQRVIHEYDTMIAGVKVSAVEKPQVRIASFEPFTVYFLGVLAQEYLLDQKMLVLERAPGGIEQGLLTREADIGITYAPVPHRELEFLKICSFQKGIYIKRGAFSGVPFEEIPFAAPFTPVHGSPTGISSLDGWPNDAPRNLRFQLEMLEATLEFCRLGLAAIFCPDFVVALQNKCLLPEHRLHSVPFPKGMAALKRTVYLVKRKDDPEDLTAKRIAKAIRQICVRP